MAPLFSGVGVALVSLFDDDGGLDAPATAGLKGAILVLANAEPERCVAAFGGDGPAPRVGR